MTTMTTASVRRQAGAWQNFGIAMKLIFIKIVQVMEICALPYLAGIGTAIASEWHLGGSYDALRELGLPLVTTLLFGPVVIFYALFLWLRKQQQPRASILYFLEDKLSEHRFTQLLMLVLVAVAFTFGVFNYNFATDTAAPAHILRFLPPPGQSVNATITGTIIREPEFRERHVWLFLKPTQFQAADGPRQVVTDGLVLVKISKNVPGFENYEYGQAVAVTSDFAQPEPAGNPGAFDQKKHLNNRNIFAQSTVGRPDQVRDLGMRDASFAIKFSLDVKKRLLAIMKQTLPYPHSSFQGGIIYGLKVGLPKDQEWEFKWAGMAWVLVVAGAHLLMVYITLKMILASLRLHPYLSFVLLFIMLFIFLVVTGIGPPTVRAFIMLFLYEVTKTFLGQDIHAAVRSAIGIAAFLLLAVHAFPYFSPLMIFDPTVTLSFGAVLSLSWLSGPVMRLFGRIAYGMTSIVLLLGIVAVTLVFAYLQPTTATQMIRYLVPVFALTAVLVALTTKFNNKFRVRYRLHRIWSGYNDIRLFSGWRKWIHPQFFAYRSLPPVLMAFAAAQIAIQFGMVLPTSSWYFGRTPIGGIFANLIAFPGLGIIIQVGLCAVLVGLIPLIGMPLAFLLNACDYLGIELLMQTAKITARIFTYPIALKPTLGQIFAFYTVIAAFIFFDKLFYDRTKHGYMNLQQLFAQKFRLRRKPLYGRLAERFKARGQRWLATGGILCAIALTSAGLAYNPDPGSLRVIMMDLNGGIGTVVMAPAGGRYLVDFGRYEPRRGFRDTQNSFAPVALSNQIETFDGIVLSHPSLETMGGLWFVLENFEVHAVYSALDPGAFAADCSIDSFVAATRDRRIINSRSTADVEALHDIFMACGELIRRKRIRVVKLSAGQAIDEAGGFRFTAINPAADLPAAEPGDASLVLRLEYQGKRVLLGGVCGPDALAQLARDNAVAADVLLTPANGDPDNNPDAFVQAVKAKFAVIQFQAKPRNDEARLAAIAETQLRYSNAGALVYRTDRSGAITAEITPAGQFSVTPFCPLDRSGISEGEE